MLWVSEEGVGLWSRLDKASKPYFIDFVGGAMGYRSASGRASHEMLVKAAGLTVYKPMRLLDATAGLGRDAWLLASLGYSIDLVERSPVLVLMLADALQRAELDDEAGAVARRLRLLQVDARERLTSLKNLPDERPDIIFIDPMFPERRKSAKVKKEMQLLQQLLGHDDEADTLLPLALQVAKKRVVVKRPRLAPALAQLDPSWQLTGKSHRFDIYQLNSV